MAFTYKQAFTKPKDLKYTDMCIYVDKIAYKENKTEEEEATLYKYIYLIIFGLACKKKYLTKVEDYDDFSIFATYKIWNRLHDPRQFEEKYTSGKKLEKIKSILNYVKNCLYGLKVDWCNSNYKQIFNSDVDSRFDFIKYKSDLKSNIENEYIYNSPDFSKAIIETIYEIKDIINKVVNETPYRNDKIMHKKLYQSCLISFIKSITLSNKNILRIQNKSNSDNSQLYFNIYKEERLNSVTLWHLDNTYYDYIALLVNKIRHQFLHSLIEVKEMYSLSDDVLESILLSSSEIKPVIKGDMNFD